MPVPSSDEHFEGHVDRLIREAIERGEFEGLPGEGKPIPGVGTIDDDLWWVRRWARRNLVPGERGSVPRQIDSPQDPSSSS